MMMDRDEQDIKRVFESIETPEYDIASAVLQEKNNRCEVIPLRKVAVMAVSLLVVVSLISVIAIANFGQGKWVDPGSSITPLAGNDMEQNDIEQSETDEFESSLADREVSTVIIQEESQVAENDASSEEQSSETSEETSIDPIIEQGQREAESLDKETNDDEINIMYNKDSDHPEGLVDCMLVDIRKEEQFYRCLENFRIPINSLYIPRGYKFTHARLSYQEEIDGLLGEPTRVIESEHVVCYCYKLTQELMNEASSLTVDFESQDKQIFSVTIELTSHLNLSSEEYEHQDEKPIEGFDLTSTRTSLGSKYDIGYNFYKEIDPAIRSAWEGFYIHRTMRFMRISVFCNNLPKSEAISIAQSIVKNL